MEGSALNNTSSIGIVVLVGGISNEREISLGSGRPCAAALARRWPTRMVDVVDSKRAPEIDRQREVVFSTLHGTFGEDGQMQRLLDEAGVAYAGCDAASSALTFDKQRTKQVCGAAGCQVAPGLVFSSDTVPSVDDLVAELGEAVVIKPCCGGSSLGLSICQNRSEVAAALAKITEGSWLAEPKIEGREVTVGVINGRALPIVEIVAQSGVYDYAAKYTKGLTEFLVPAPLSEATTQALQQAAETAFAACGCRDYARIDFMITEKNDLFLLEINTLPGMKETSLLPMGARSAGTPTVPPNPQLAGHSAGDRPAAHVFGRAFPYDHGICAHHCECGGRGGHRLGGLGDLADLASGSAKTGRGFRQSSG